MMFRCRRVAEARPPKDSVLSPFQPCLIFGVKETSERQGVRTAGFGIMAPATRWDEAEGVPQRGVVRTGCLRIERGGATVST